MRLAIITATPANVALGSGTFVAAENLRCGLATLGHEARLVTPARPLTGPAFGIRRLLFNLSLTPAQAGGADILAGFDLDGWTLASRAGRPYVACLHGVIADEARFEQGPTAWSMRAQARVERHASRRANLVIVPSAYSAGRVMALYGVPADRIAVAPPGVDLGRWAGALHGAPTRTDQRPRVVAVGRMYPRKDHATLLRAAAVLRDRVPGVQVRLVGDGPRRSALERLARALGLEDTVTFTGQVPFATLAAEYAAADVFCLPSRQEGFGIAFVEAMAAGLPVVAARAAAAPEVIPEDAGILVPPGNHADLAAALGQLLRDAERRAAMGHAGRRAAARFGLVPAAERFLHALDRLAACQNRAARQ